jgi:hypothetical protein
VPRGSLVVSSFIFTLFTIDFYGGRISELSEERIDYPSRLLKHNDHADADISTELFPLLH